MTMYKYILALMCLSLQAADYVIGYNDSRTAIIGMYDTGKKRL